MKISDHLNIDNYNLFITNGSKPTAGYKLKLDKIIKKKNQFKIYLTEIKPPEKTMSAAVLTYPFCLLKVNDMKKFKIYINDNEMKK